MINKDDMIIINNDDMVIYWKGEKMLVRKVKTSKEKLVLRVSLELKTRWDCIVKSFAESGFELDEEEIVSEVVRKLEAEFRRNHGAA